MMQDNALRIVSPPTSHLDQIVPVMSGPFHDSMPMVWVVERLDIDGEELPVIRHATSWLPAPIALRYALRTRFRLGPQSLTTDMRAIAHMYNWSESIVSIGNFEDYLVSGQFLDRQELLQLVACLRRRHGETNSGIVSSQVFNSRVFAVSQYLEWAIEPTNHGGVQLLDEDECELQISKMVRLLQKERLIVGRSHRLEPLTPLEIRLIRQAIAPDEFGRFPPNVFSEKTRYRNWIMFEFGLNLGERKGEILTTRLKHLSGRGRDGCIFVPRQQDTKEDPRTRRRPRGKTNERIVPLRDKNILPSILMYRDAPPPLGRNDPSITTDYAFVTETGQPISISTADYIIKQIGKYAARLLDSDTTLDKYTRAQLKESLLALTWHRVRHTWAEQTALELYRKHGEGAWAILKEWGGWSCEASMEHYIQYARRMINEQAAREYQSTLRSRSSK